MSARGMGLVAEDEILSEVECEAKLLGAVQPDDEWVGRVCKHVCCNSSSSGGDGEEKIEAAVAFCCAINVCDGYSCVRVRREFETLGEGGADDINGAAGVDDCARWCAVDPHR